MVNKLIRISTALHLQEIVFGCYQAQDIYRRVYFATFPRAVLNLIFYFFFISILLLWGPVPDPP